MNLCIGFAPVTHCEYTTLRWYSMSNFKCNSGAGEYLPIQTNPIINAKALIDFFNTYGSGKSGIRFYPGFQGQKLVMLMCLDNEISSERIDNWCILEKGFYLEPDSNLINATAAQANVTHMAYLSQIIIDGEHHAPLPRFRISRFYPWNEVFRYINDNLQGGDFADFFLHLEWGFVPDDIASTFNVRYPAGGPEYHRGFTVIMHVKDKDGNPLIDVQLPYEAGQYTRTYLEVGSPCPPRCGII